MYNEILSVVNFAGSHPGFLKNSLRT